MVGLGGGAQGNGDSSQDGECRRPAIPATFVDTEIFRYFPEVKYAKLQSYFVATTVFQRPEILAPSKTFTSSQPPTHIIYLLHIPTADAIMRLFSNNWPIALHGRQ